MKKIIAPKGTKDIFPPEIVKWHYLEEKLRDYFPRFMYKEIRTPIFEYVELFQRGIGTETEVVQKEMYTFKDKANRDLTLRPENTASVVRAAIENDLFNRVLPLRFFYIGPMFRYDKPQKGRFRQFHQFGVEVFGDESAQVDAEVIYSSYDFLKEINVSDIQLHLNSVGCENCRPNFLKHLRTESEKRMKELCVDCQRKIHTNPLRIFDCKNLKCIEISNDFPKIIDYLCKECGTHFEEVKEALSIFKIKFDLNPRLVRGLDYYTKTAFEITSSQLGAQDALLGGGRYNNLIKELGGADISGMGFAAGIERIMLQLDDVKHKKDKMIFIAYQSLPLMNKAIQLAKSLWDKGYCVYVDYNLKNLKKQLKKANKIGIDYTFIIGEDEIVNESISIKSMKNYEQITIKQEELDKWLINNI